MNIETTIPESSLKYEKVTYHQNLVKTERYNNKEVDTFTILTSDGPQEYNTPKQKYELQMRNTEKGIRATYGQGGPDQTAQLMDTT